MTVPLTSTSYPTLAVIQHFGVTDQAAKTAIWERSAVWGDRFWTNQVIASRPSLDRLVALFGDRAYEIDAALANGQMRAWSWCQANR